jgi:hypothetical protein
MMWGDVTVTSEPGKGSHFDLQWSLSGQSGERRETGKE